MTDAERAEQAVTEAVTAFKDATVAKPRSVPTSLSDQHAAILRASAELRRRINEERISLVLNHERRVLELKEQYRRDMAALQADLDARLRENDLIAPRVEP